MNAYKNSIQKVHLSGPTLFCPMLESMNSLVSKSLSDSSYYILLILTDGEVRDMDKTIEALIESSDLPLSVIIIGIGEDQDFENMHMLDCDSGKLKNDKHEAKRDVVQFVRFEKFHGNTAHLASAVLQEIPKQFMAYTDMKGFKPVKI
jgi:copine 5/8/9